MKAEINIMWFRQDLRLTDNLALTAAVESGDVLPIYIIDDNKQNSSRIGSASKIWLNQSLIKINNSLGKTLNLYIGEAVDIFTSLLEKYNIKSIFWNNLYEPLSIIEEDKLKTFCINNGIKAYAFNSNYLWSPQDILKEDNSYYKVFTPYKKKALLISNRLDIKAPTNPTYLKDKENNITISDLDLIPQQHTWHQSIQRSWDIGEKAAQEKLHFFIKNNLNGYKEDRNYPAKNKTSKLSPHLHFGEISPVQIWNAVSSFGHLYAKEFDIEHFFSELIWREFSCYLLYHFNSLETVNFNSKFDHFGWEKNNQPLLKAWQTGNTGYPLVDAGMRELWHTGYMHNRVRMVTASFLIKNLNIHWHQGQSWFWDCLVDADLGNNSASWQWVAGSGADAAPYFRIFNPVMQGEKFDPEGDYTRKFVPELTNLPNKYLFTPWLAPEEILKSAGINLGTTYPLPIVDFASSRNNALERYKNLPSI